MFKKLRCAALAARLVLSSAAFAEGELVLSKQVIVDGTRIYYAGSLDSGADGVYSMNATSSGVNQISDSYMNLLAAAEGNLLALSFSEGNVEYAVLVIAANGARTMVYDGYVDHGIEANGRFYWGVGSCALDGSDVRLLIDDREHSYNYYPLTVDGDYYYYLDWAANSEGVFNEGSYPLGARLCRLNLTSGAMEQISGYGTRYLGMDENYVYFTRNGFWVYDNSDDTTYYTSVDEGVFRADKNTLTTDLLLAFPQDDNVYVSYTLMSDGVIYGTYSNFTEEGEVSSIVRLTTDGQALTDLNLDNQSVTLHGVEDGLLYVSVCTIENTGDDYMQHDLLYSINVEDGSVALISTPATDMLYYSEAEPAVGVSFGRIYMLVFDNETYAISFKTCAVDGSDMITLARGYSMAAG